MALCKSCGAPVRIGKTCECCGRFAEPDDIMRKQCLKALNSLEWMEVIEVDIVLPEYRLPDNTERVRHGMAEA